MSHGQIHTYTGTQEHTSRAKRKSMELGGGALANHVYDEELVPKIYCEKEKNVKIGKGS